MWYKCIGKQTNRALLLVSLKYKKLAGFSLLTCRLVRTRKSGVSMMIDVVLVGMGMMDLFNGKVRIA